MIIGQSQVKNPERPSNIPKEAEWLGTLTGKDGAWILNTESKNGKSQVWYPNGEIQRENFILKGKKLLFTKEYYENGKEKEIGQAIFLNYSDGHKNLKHYFSYGKWLYFDQQGKLERQVCFSSEEKTTNLNLECGEEIRFNSDGSVKEKIQHKQICKLGCGEFRPFLELGKYKIVGTNVRMRENPSTKGKIIAELQKDELLEVMEDTKKIESIGENTYPWVKVQTNGGKIGFVYGAFIEKMK